MMKNKFKNSRDTFKIICNKLEKILKNISSVLRKIKLYTSQNLTNFIH